MHKPNKSILYLKFVDWSIPARARRRPAMGTGQLRSLSAAAASLAWLGLVAAALGDE